MKFSVGCLLVCLSLIVLVSCQGPNGRGRPNRGRNGGKRPKKDYRKMLPAGSLVYKWNRTLPDSQVTVWQAAVTLDNATVTEIKLVSFDKQLRQAGFSSGAILYDFDNSGNPRAVALKTGFRRRPICFILPNSINTLTFSAIETELQNRNNTVLAAPTAANVNLATSDTPLTDAEITAQTTSNPQLASFCNGRGNRPIDWIIATTTTTAFADGVDVIKYLALDNVLNIERPNLPAPPAFGQPI